METINGNTFLGTIDEVSVYNRALSGNEINAIYVAIMQASARRPKAFQPPLVLCTGGKQMGIPMIQPATWRTIFV
jgi:hypothetical protein